jgi:hypothetical protein
MGSEHAVVCTVWTSVAQTQLYLVNLNLLQEVPGQQISGGIGKFADLERAWFSKNKFTGQDAAGVLKFCAYNAEKS